MLWPYEENPGAQAEGLCYKSEEGPKSRPFEAPFKAQDKRGKKPPLEGDGRRKMFCDEVWVADRLRRRSLRKQERPKSRLEAGAT